MITSTMVTTNALDLVLPKGKGKTDSNKSVSVSVNSALQFFIDKTPVEEAQLEATLLTELSKTENKSIVIRAEKDVPIEKVVFIMDIANRNQLKTVLAVNPK